jgi:hypothetical protein
MLSGLERVWNKVVYAVPGPQVVGGILAGLRLDDADGTDLPSERRRDGRRVLSSGVVLVGDDDDLARVVRDADATGGVRWRPERDDTATLGVDPVPLPLVPEAHAGGRAAVRAAAAL